MTIEDQLFHLWCVELYFSILDVTHNTYKYLQHI